MADNPLWAVLGILRDTTTHALATATGGALTCVIHPGRDVALDEYCDGQAWLRVIRQYPSTTAGFPDPARGNNTPCTATDLVHATEIGIGTVRCTPGLALDDHGQPPVPTDLETAARHVLDDADRIRRALTCPPEQLATIALTIGQWLPVGPEGIRVGGELTLTIGLHTTEEDTWILNAL